MNLNELHQLHLQNVFLALCLLHKIVLQEVRHFGALLVVFGQAPALAKKVQFFRKTQR